MPYSMEEMEKVHVFLPIGANIINQLNITESVIWSVLEVREEGHAHALVLLYNGSYHVRFVLQQVCLLQCLDSWHSQQNRVPANE